MVSETFSKVFLGVDLVLSIFVFWSLVFDFGCSSGGSDLIFFNNPPSYNKLTDSPVMVLVPIIVRFSSAIAGSNRPTNT